MVHKSPPSTEPQCSVLSCKHQEQNNMRSPNYCSTHTHHTSQGLIKSPAKSEDLPDWLKPRGKKGENGNYFLLEILSVISRCLKEKKRKKKTPPEPQTKLFSFQLHHSPPSWSQKPTPGTRKPKLPSRCQQMSLSAVLQRKHLKELSFLLPDIK